MLALIRGFEPIADVVLPVEECDVAPRMAMHLAIVPDVLDDPGFLEVVGVEADGAHRERARAVGTRDDLVLEDRRVERGLH